MTKNLKAPLFTFLFLPLVMVRSQTFDDSTSMEVCLEKTNVLKDDMAFANANKAMLDAFNATCIENNSCSTEAVSLGATTKNDYTVLVTGNSLGLMESACNEIVPGSTLCLVTNEIMKTNLRTLEINKPVCFPPTCDEKDINEVRFLDPTPGSCDPASTSDSCSIISTSVSCPKLRSADYDANTCPTDASTILADSSLRRFVSTLRTSVTRGCLNVLMGGSSPVCEIVTPLVVTATKNYTEFHDAMNADYEAFKEECINARESHSLCKISTHINAMESDAFIALDSDITYTDLPLCLPSDCTNQDPVAIANEQLVKNAFDCESASSVCNVVVTDLTCETNDESLFPTTSPTNAPSAQTTSPTNVATTETTSPTIVTTTETSSPNNSSLTDKSSADVSSPTSESSGSYLAHGWVNYGYILIMTFCSSIWFII